MTIDIQMIFQVFQTASERQVALRAEGRPAMLYVEQGAAVVDGVSVEAGGAAFLAADRKGAVRFDGRVAVWLLGQVPERTAVFADLQMHAPLDLAPGDHLFRLDAVGFPPGARAYRHVHPGPGIRFLVEGELEIRGDGHATTVTAGQPWFEAANAPVTATCRADRPSRFVRAHLLPADYLGKPSIRYLDDADQDKPRLQTTHRFCEHLIRL